MVVHVALRSLQVELAHAPVTGVAVNADEPKSMPRVGVRYTYMSLCIAEVRRMVLYIDTSGIGRTDKCSDWSRLVGGSLRQIRNHALSCFEKVRAVFAPMGAPYSGQTKRGGAATTRGQTAPRCLRCRAAARWSSSRPCQNTRM